MKRLFFFLVFSLFLSNFLHAETGSSIYAATPSYGPGGLPAHVKVFDQSHTIVGSFFAFGANYLKGVNLTMAPVLGEESPNVVVTPKGGMAPWVRIFDYNSFSGVPRCEFLAYDANFQVGIRTATMKVGNTYYLVTVPTSGGPHIKVYDLRRGCGEVAKIQEFFAFDASFNQGLYVTSGQLDPTNPNDQLVISQVGTSNRQVKIYWWAPGYGLSVVRQFTENYLPASDPTSYNYLKLGKSYYSDASPLIANHRIVFQRLVHSYDPNSGSWSGGSYVYGSQFDFQAFHGYTLFGTTATEVGNIGMNFANPALTPSLYLAGSSLIPAASMKSPYGTTSYILTGLYGNIYSLAGTAPMISQVFTGYTGPIAIAAFPK